MTLPILSIITKVNNKINKISKAITCSCTKNNLICTHIDLVFYETDFNKNIKDSNFNKIDHGCNIIANNYNRNNYRYNAID